VETQEEEEIIFRVQGVLIRKDLPPIHETPRYVPIALNPRKHTGATRHMCQSIEISGLGLKDFKDALDHLQVRHASMARNHPENTVEPWIPRNYRGTCALESSNKYFTTRQHDRGRPPVTFLPGVDPKGKLAQLAGNEYIHLQENLVSFAEIVNGRATDTTLSTFHIGDIVEAQISAKIIPCGPNTYQLIPVLRGFLLWQSAFLVVSSK
ncbi:hypothetical protein HYDPIDRAFT_97566, partial [Hydnomerulius pinastri MD-312]